MGEAAGEGAILGAGTAGAFSVPSVASRTAGQSVRAAADAANALTTGRAEAVRERIAEQSPVSPARMAEDQAQYTPEVVTESVQSLAPEVDVAPVRDKIAETVRVSTPELEQLSDGVFDMIMQVIPEGTPVTRQALSGIMAARAMDESLPREERIEAGAFLLDQDRRVAEIGERDLVDYMNNADQSSDSYKQVAGYLQMLNQAMQVPAVQEAMEWAKGKAVIDVTDAPVTQKTANEAASIAEVAPQNVSPAAVREILKQDTSGVVTLAPAARKALSASLALNETGDLFARLAQLDEATTANTPASISGSEPEGFKPHEIVTEQIEKSGGYKPHMKSMAQHVAEINDAVLGGDIEQGTAALSGLNKFAQHMINKLDALNVSLQSGTGSPKSRTPYQALGEDGTFSNAGGKYDIWGNFNHENSMKLANIIAAQTAAVVQLSNNMNTIYPELGGKMLTAPALATAPVAETTQTVTETAQDKPQEAKAPAKAETTAKPEKAVKKPVEASTQIEMDLEIKPEPKIEPVKETTPVKEASPVVEKPADKPVVEAVKTEPVKEEIKEETTEPALSSAEETVGKLIQIGDKQNRFVQAFSQPKTVISRLMGEANPIAYLNEQIDRVQNLAHINYAVSPNAKTLWKGLINLGNSIADDLATNVNDYLNKKNSAGKSMIDYAKEGSNVQSWANGRLMNLVNEDYELNPKIAQIGGLAAIDALINGRKTAVVRETEDLAKDFGISVDVVMADAKFVNAINSGMNRGDYLDNLSTRIVQYLGLEQNKKSSRSNTVGIPQALALEVLASMEALGLVRSEKVSIPTTTREVEQLYFDNDVEQVRNVNNIVKNLKGTDNLLSDLITVKPHREFFAVGENTFDVPTHQTRNPMVKLTNKEREMIENQQNTPNYLNMPFFKLATDMGLDNLTLFQGGKQYEEGGVNAMHERTLEGKNRTIRTSYENVVRQVEQIQAYSKKNNTQLDDTPVFMQYGIIRTGRSQALGLNSNQSDKFTRQVLMPHKTVLDMTKPEVSDQFWMTIAQGLGVKTEKDLRAVAVQKAKDMAFGKFNGHVEQLVSWLNGTKLPENFTSTLIDVWDNGQSMHGLDAILSVARLVDAQRKGQDMTAYPYNGYLEADGKTNGPIMALVMFMAGNINRKWLKLVRKGGYFPGEQNMTLNSHQLRDSADLYKHTADSGARIQFDRMSALLNVEKTAPYVKAAVRLLTALNSDIRISKDGRSLVIERGAAKTPLTITIYGSGVDGIAGNVANELMRIIYAKISETMQSNGKKLGEVITDGEGNPYGAATFIKDLQLLTGSHIGKRGDAWDLYEGKGKRTDYTVNMRDFALTSRDFTALRNNMKAVFVEPLVQAVNQDVLSHIAKQQDAIQQATNIQSIVASQYFNMLVVQRMAERSTEPDYEKGDDLSQADLDVIYAEVLKAAPLIKSSNQNFLIGGRERTATPAPVKFKYKGKDVTVTVPSYLARRTTNEVGSQNTYYAPSPAGVAGMPTLTIGFGDANMMLHAATGSDPVQNSTLIFDGGNMSADRIDTDGVRFNKAVFDVWSDNPLKYISDSYGAFANANILERMNASPLGQQFIKPILEELSKAYYNTSNPESILTLEAAQLYLNSKADDLSLYAEEAQLRIDAMNELPASIDQMASAEAPYQHKGKINIDNTLDADAFDQAIVDEVNKLIDAKRNQGKKDEVAAEDKAIADSLDSFSYPEGDVRIGTPVSMEILFDNLKTEASADQSGLIKQIAKVLSGKDIKIVFGTPDALNNYAGKSIIENENGAYDPATGNVYVTNMNAETILHELIHVSTYGAVVDYVENPSALNVDTRNAVERIEALMSKWLRQNADTQGAAYTLARDVVSNYLDNGNRAAAINEYMAWALSNQTLIETGKKMNVLNKLARDTRDTLAAIKVLIWGDKKAPKVGDYFYSNLRYNTRIILETTDTDRLVQAMQRNALYQSNAFGENDRVAEFSLRFLAKFNNVLRNTAKTHQPYVKKRYERLHSAADVSVAKLDAAGFNFTMQEKGAYLNAHAALSLYKDIDANAMAKVTQLHKDMLERLKFEDFMADPESNNQNHIQEAQSLFNAALGMTAEDYISLGMVNDRFRAVLNKLGLPKSLKDDSGTIDAYLDNAGASAMDALSDKFAGTSKAQSVTDAMAVLAMRMSVIEADQTTFIERTYNDVMDKADDFIKSNMNALTDTVVKYSKNRTGNKALDSAKAVAGGIAKWLNTSTSEEAAEAITAALNKTDVPAAVRELNAEIAGRTKWNAPIFDMISRVRSQVQQARQQFLEHLPSVLESKFKESLTNEQWATLHQGLGKTSVASLISVMSPEKLRNLLSDAKSTAKKMDDLRSLINGHAGSNAVLTIKKADELANYLATGEAPINFLRNAYAIANLLGENVSKKPAVTDDYVSNLEQYVALKAWSLQPKEVNSTITSLLQNEAEGMDFLLSYLSGSIKEEKNKLTTDEARFNYFMGNMPMSYKQGVDLIVASDTEHNRLRMLGYERIGDYSGSSSDLNRGRMGYYYSPVSGTATYNQGVMQTVKQTVFGVDPDTGYMVNKHAGRITDVAEVKAITQRIKREANTDERLLPVYGANGLVVAYERSFSPAKLASIQAEPHLALTIGQWRGRQIEEFMSSQLNDELLGKLKDIWEEAKATGRSDEFVDLSSSTDPIYLDSWKLVPKTLRKHIGDVFGEDGFPIRKDMIIDTVGTRSASIGDHWTGNTRINPAVSKHIQTAATSIFGSNAYKYMIKAEQGVQSLVSDAKVLIVVKSVIVPVANLVSNMYQLANRGVPLRTILNGVGKKAAELNEYTKSYQKKVQLEATLFEARANGSIYGVRRAEAQLKAIEAANRKLSIWPLIEAGEYTAITDGGISQADIALANGRWTNFVEKTANALPESLQTPFRYAMVSKDTALFKGLTKSVQYGDFLAKAILYDHSIKKGLSQEDALGEGAQAFINYNRYAGRTRGYAESIGLLWFWNFKLRIMKEAGYLIRHNPARALLLMNTMPRLPMLGSVGSPLTDNFLSIAANGKLDYSVGPWMGLRAPTMNPWWQMIN